MWMFWITITKTILLIHTLRYPTKVSTSFRQYLISVQVLFMTQVLRREFVTSLTQVIQSRVVVSDWCGIWCGIGPTRYRIGGFSPQQGVSDPKIGVITREYPGESSDLTFPKIPPAHPGNTDEKVPRFGVILICFTKSLKTIMKECGSFDIVEIPFGSLIVYGESYWSSFSLKTDSRYAGIDDSPSQPFKDCACRFQTIPLLFMVFIIKIHIT